MPHLLYKILSLSHCLIFVKFRKLYISRNILYNSTYYKVCAQYTTYLFLEITISDLLFHIRIDFHAQINCSFNYLREESFLPRFTRDNIYVQHIKYLYTYTYVYICIICRKYIYVYALVYVYAYNLNYIYFKSILYSLITLMKQI